MDDQPTQVHAIEPDPRQIHSLADLARELTRLRRREARRGQVQLSIRDLATRTGVAASTLEPYLQGKRLCPADTYERLLRALGIPTSRLGPWLDAWERLAERTVPRPRAGDQSAGRHRSARDGARIVPDTRTMTYALAQCEAVVGIVTGELRKVRSAQVWVNSENTDMEMARYNDYSVSAVIRFHGARRDETGRVIDDLIADDLKRRTSGRPVAAATAISTGPGMLAESNGVRHIVHVAAVQGEPASGYRQVLDVGRCVSNALWEAERLAERDPVTTAVLFPLLGVGTGGGDLLPTAVVMVGAAVDHLVASARCIRAVYLLACTEPELDACVTALDSHPGLVRREPAS